jgi:SAM-dependent methyltransferase
VISPEALQHAELQRTLLGEAGWRLSAGAAVLDFGCGDGRLVSAWRAAGYDARGCDIALERETDALRLIPTDPYRVPFADEQFELVVSDQVLEHVADHEAAFREIARVLRPGGAALHIFPSRLRPIEPHTFVPLGGVLQQRGWLRLWAAIGVRNSFQRGKSAADVAERNRQYLRDSTTYLTRRQLVALAQPHFRSIRFAEGEMLAHTYGRARVVGRIPLVRRAATPLYAALHMRVVLTFK